MKTKDPLNTVIDSRPAFLITIDTEGDNLWSRPDDITTDNAAFLPRFQLLCEEYSLKPTYLTNWEMAGDDRFMEIGHDIARRGVGEIGMHLHAWNSPPIVPLTENDYFHQPFLIEYPEPVRREKIRRLTDALEETLAIKMRSHRAGRWAFDHIYAQQLIEHGYVVDCSVTPHLSWKRSLGAPHGSGGSDYTHFPEAAYWVDEQNIAAPGASDLLEVPMTVMPKHERAMKMLGRKLLRRDAAEPLMLRPKQDNLNQLLEVLTRALDDGRDYVEFMLHSSELMPGGSPVFSSDRSIEALYDDLAALFSAASDRFVGLTLSEYHARYLSGLAGRAASAIEREQIAS